MDSWESDVFHAYLGFQTYSTCIQIGDCIGSTRKPGERHKSSCGWTSFLFCIHLSLGRWQPVFCCTETLVAGGVTRTVWDEKGTAHLISHCHCMSLPIFPRLRSHEKRSKGFLEDLKEQCIDLQLCRAPKCVVCGFTSFASYWRFDELWVFWYFDIRNDKSLCHYKQQHCKKDREVISEQELVWSHKVLSSMVFILLALIYIHFNTSNSKWFCWPGAPIQQNGADGCNSLLCKSPSQLPQISISCSLVTKGIGSTWSRGNYPTGAGELGAHQRPSVSNHFGWWLTFHHSSHEGSKFFRWWFWWKANLE